LEIRAGFSFLANDALGFFPLSGTRLNATERRPMSRIAAGARTADRIDYWIRRHLIQSCYGTYPSQSNRNPARDRRVGLSAIGQCLKDQYDALATPIPPHLAALVKQLETQETGIGRSARHRGEHIRAKKIN
jgi:hypothetical protein